MRQILKKWVGRYFSDEEALILLAVMLGVSLLFVMLGSVLVPILTGIVLAYVMQGVINQLQRLRVPRSFSVTVTYLLFLGGFVGFLLFLLPRFWRQLGSLYRDLPELSDRLSATLVLLQAHFPLVISERQISVWVNLLSDEATALGQWLLTVSISQLPVLITVLGYTLLVPILVFFLLKDKDQLLSYCLGFLPEERPLMHQIGSELSGQMENYVRGKFLELIIAGLVTYGLFAFFGLNYAALLGFLVGVSVIIPYLGIAAVTVPVTIVALMQFGLSSDFFYLMLGYLVIQALDGLVLVPILFSEANNLHPLAIILAVLIFGAWFGLAGVFFAIPLAILMKALLSAWPRRPV